MLTNFFAKSKPINSIILTAIFFMLFFLMVFTNNIEFQIMAIPLFLLVLGIVNFINKKNELTFDNSFMFLFFVLLIGFFPKTISINTTFYANLTLLLFLRKVYSLQSSKKVNQKLFDGGLWLGISFLIEPFSIVFAVLLFVSIYLHQHFTVRNLLIPSLGFLVPVFLFFTYCFWYDKTADFSQLFMWYTDYDFTLYLNVEYLVPFFLIGFFLLISILLKTPKALSVKNTFRKSWILVLAHLLTAIFLLILIEDKHGSEVLFVLFPMAIILANGLELYQKELVSTIVLTIFFIGSITMVFV